MYRSINSQIIELENIINKIKVDQTYKQDKSFEDIYEEHLLFLINTCININNKLLSQKEPSKKESSDEEQQLKSEINELELQKKNIELQMKIKNRIKIGNTNTDDERQMKRKTINELNNQIRLINEKIMKKNLQLDNLIGQKFKSGPTVGRNKYLKYKKKYIQLKKINEENYDVNNSNKNRII